VVAEAQKKTIRENIDKQNKTITDKTQEIANQDKFINSDKSTKDQRETARRIRRRWKVISKKQRRKGRGWKSGFIPSRGPAN
jgi:hypothetical protein